MAQQDIVIDTFKLDPESTNWGYPIWCPGDQPKLVHPPFPNPYVKDVLEVHEELEQFREDVNEVFHQTGAPPFPLILHHFCLPFSPFCCMFHCKSKRRTGLEELITSWNNKVGVPRGLFLEWNLDYNRYFNPGISFFNQKQVLVVQPILKGHIVNFSSQCKCPPHPEPEPWHGPEDERGIPAHFLPEGGQAVCPAAFHHPVPGVATAAPTPRMCLPTKPDDGATRRCSRIPAPGGRVPSSGGHIPSPHWGVCVWPTNASSTPRGKL